MIFTDRTDAGRQLAARLDHFKGENPVVVGLPRGGVVVAAQVAQALDAPLDVCLVRKLGVPFQPELAMGAIGEDGVRVVNDEVVRGARVFEDELAAAEAQERTVLERRAYRYRGERPPIELTGRTVLVVDDGVATGSTARAGCRIVRGRGAGRVVLAVPVAPRGWTAWLGQDADELVCLHTPVHFYAIGQFYADFRQTTDDDVVDCLRRAARRADGQTPAAPPTRSGDPPPAGREVEVRAGTARLGGHLTVPENATGIVVFAHGSGSSRHSPRNRFVAAGLNQAGLGTLLFDLLTEDEGMDRAKVFDTELLASRLAQATDWLYAEPETKALAVGYFGASTGAAAALWAAAEPGACIAAIVSRGGRPDLAGPRLPQVTAPTLLIVGGNDTLVLELNWRAQAQLCCENRLEVVPGATHLFEEPGTLEKVTQLASDWFTNHLAPAPQPSG
ncbi:phosphoribosyltransferase [Streptomyces sp. RB6PN25]|uniref:Phosphoribosyltransferase n=1 Tax=Streptomyces humicola TaxID=2953240 RepID=A0ABT1Q1V6_9ACTN|nr:phosphoribosyltransferase family protein [Streptomyces humicola]MCQ4083892.1 phosphoribosyltransferase [Streptomyces humicola]